MPFEREPGYFMGALYLSYGMGIPAVAVLAAMVYLVRPSLAPGTILLVASALFLPLVPVVFRASRVLWIHFDRAIDRDS